MEHICRVQTPWTDALSRETYWPSRYYNKKRKLQYARIILASLVMNAIGIWMTVSAIKYNWFDSFYWRLVYLAVIGVYLYLDYRVIFEVPIYVRKERNRRRKLIGNQVTCTDVLFYENYLWFRSGVSSATSTTAYADIIAVHETKHYCLLRTDTTIFCFSKTGFVDGSYEQALWLIKEKANIQ